MPSPSPSTARTRHRRLSAAAASVASLALASTMVGSLPSATAVAGPIAATNNTNVPASTVVTPSDFRGYGFDQCVAPTQKSMTQWLRHSPFLAVGIYISGDSRACRNQPNLSRTWINKQLADGWKILPIALGPQASCQPRFPRYADDFRISAKRNTQGKYAKAAQQGVAEANKNAADAGAYGIAKGSTLWYDLEGFDMRNTGCRESALQFVSSWSARTKQLGYVPGMYSSASSGIKMVDDARVNRAGQFTLPSQLWIADWDGGANTNSTYLRSDGWKPGGRMKQYRGGHNETWGGVTINIDSNYLDLGRGAYAAPQKAWCGGVDLNLTSFRLVNSRYKNVSQVRAMQCMLKLTGRKPGPITGTLTAQTKAAVARYQRANAYPVGRWTRPMWQRILSGGSVQVLKVGSTGARVYRLQRALNASVGGVVVNGVFDSRTKSAVMAYQKRVKLAPSGIANLQTWKALQTGRM